MPPYMYSAGAYPCSAERRNHGIAEASSESVGVRLSIERPSSYSAEASPVPALLRKASMSVGCGSHTAPVCGLTVCADDAELTSWEKVANRRKVRTERIPTSHRNAGRASGSAVVKSPLRSLLGCEVSRLFSADRLTVLSCQGEYPAAEVPAQG